MTHSQLTLRAADIHRSAIGFETLFDELSRINAQQINVNYPPYNLIKYTDDKFSIELAVAGFSEGEVDVVLEKNILTVRGEQTSTDETPREYVHRGISSRNFERSFTLAEHVEVIGATVTNGILSIDLERKVPEEQKPKTIAISYQK